MKESLSHIILTILLLSQTPITTLAEDVEIDGIRYELINKAKQATVISKTPKYSGDITIPSTIEHEGIEYSITSIRQYAFYSNSDLTSVTIPNSVTSIGNDAFFSCSRMTSVNIGNSVASIGQRAFYGCSSLTSVTIPNSVNSIEEETFRGCALASVTIGNGVTSIGKSAFYGCFFLTSVNIGNSVTSIGERAFDRCSSLTSITIPNNVRSIGNSAFNECTNLVSVTIPNSVTSIGSGAFANCSGLKSVTIPNSVTNIGNNAFSNCPGLTSVHISDIAAWCRINFVNQVANPLHYAHHLYLNDEDIKDLVIPNSVTSIGGYAFYQCTSLTSVTIPNSVTGIGSGAFANCSGLTSVTIGNSIRSIGSNSFANCGNLETFTVHATSVPTTKSDAFVNSYIDYATLMVPDESLKDYQSTEPWSNFGTIKGINGNVVEKEKCATPTIHYADGKLSFECETEGAICYPTVTKPDVVNVSNNEIELGTTYKVSVYAAKPGYEDSDVATAEINLAQGSVGSKYDVNNDSEINITDALIIIDIILGRYY